MYIYEGASSIHFLSQTAMNISDSIPNYIPALARSRMEEVGEVQGELYPSIPHFEINSNKNSKFIFVVVCLNH